jgi:hypothetical protein
MPWCSTRFFLPTRQHLTNASPSTLPWQGRHVRAPRVHRIRICHAVVAACRRRSALGGETAFQRVFSFGQVLRRDAARVCATPSVSSKGSLWPDESIPGAHAAHGAGAGESEGVGRPGSGGPNALLRWRWKDGNAHCMCCVCVCVCVCVYTRARAHTHTHTNTHTNLVPLTVPRAVFYYYYYYYYY